MTGRGSLGKRRRNYIEMPGNNKQLFILGNGPSLRQNIENDLSFLQSHDSLAVNFAANAPEFGLIRPKFYLLADPHFSVTAPTPM